MKRDELLYLLNNAARRLQMEANACRGTICDDHKVYGLELEADAIRHAAFLLQNIKRDEPEDKSTTEKSVLIETKY